MTPTPTDSFAAPRTGDVRLPWETVGAEDDSAPQAVRTPIEGPGERGGVAAEDAGDVAGAVDYESPVPAEPLVDELGPAPKGGGWTLALLCAGIALIACTVLIPQADANRRLVYE